jgi:hypothetical protein
MVAALPDVTACVNPLGHVSVAVPGFVSANTRVSPSPVESPFLSEALGAVLVPVFTSPSAATSGVGSMAVGNCLPFVSPQFVSPLGASAAGHSLVWVGVVDQMTPMIERKMDVSSYDCVELSMRDEQALGHVLAFWPTDAKFPELSTVANPSPWLAVTECALNPGTMNVATWFCPAGPASPFSSQVMMTSPVAPTSFRIDRRLSASHRSPA